MTLQKPKEREIERVVQIRTIHKLLPNLLAVREPLLRIATRSFSMKFLMSFRLLILFKASAPRSFVWRFVK